MGLSRYLPRLFRRRYFTGIEDLPRLEPGAAECRPERLRIVCTRRFDDRVVRFGVPPGQARLVLMFIESEPPELGSVVGLDGDQPELLVGEVAHLAWAAESGRVRRIKRLAVQIWADLQRECDG